LVIAVAVRREGLDSAGDAAPSATVRPGSSGGESTAAAPTGGALPSIALVTPTVASPHGLEAGRTIGRTDAPATLVVWGDFQCPYCGRFTRETEPRLYSDYVIPGKLKIVYRDWVFIGPESVSAAVAARCAGDQGNFWQYHDYLSWNQHGENQGAFSRDRLDAIAAALGLDLSAFRACMAKPAVFDAVQANEAGAG
jgi:protein-disulfide isomerase